MERLTEKMTTIYPRSLHDFSPALPSTITSMGRMQWLYTIGALILGYNITKAIYNIFFNPLSKYPGPKLATFTNAWVAYNANAGRWPWVVEDVIKRYGDIVRIGPNELVFLEPRSFLDIHGVKKDLGQTFKKTNVIEGFGDTDDGLLWETDPHKHRQVSKMMSTVFSGKSVRDKEPTINKHIDITMEMFKKYGPAEDGTDVSQWIEWLALDLAVDLAYGWEMNQQSDMKNHALLDGLLAVDALSAVLQVLKIYPLLTPFAFIFVPWRVMRSLSNIVSNLKQQIMKRIEQRGNLKHSDYAEPLLPVDKPAPKSSVQIRHMVTVTGQLVLGGFDPTSTLFYMTLFFLMKNPEYLRSLTLEVREKFQNLEDLTGDTLREYSYLNAVLQEVLRLHATATHHSLPRMSPGGMVNGHFIPKGTICRSALFAYSRSPKYWHEPLSFRPERWLSSDHPKYNPAFANDDHSAHFPFITGPRQCPGREVARTAARIFIAKTLWLYDLQVVKGQNLDYEKDFTVRGMWDKPELRFRMLPVNRR